MSKSTVSAGFQKFAARTTTGKFEEARKGERMGQGIPFDVGQQGTGVVTAVIMDETKPDAKQRKFPRIRVQMDIITPESHRGKEMTVMNQTIKGSDDPEKDWSAEDAFNMALSQLEQLGCPNEITSGYEDIQEIVDWFSEEPRNLSWNIKANNYKNRSGQEVKGKRVEAYAVVPEAEVPSADNDGPAEEDPDAEYCTYNGTKHKVIADHDDTVDLENVNSGRKRTNIPKEQVTF